MKNVKEYYAKDRADWRKWLEKNHDKETSIWLVVDKGKARKMSWEDIVQEALCFGWIDSTAGTVSDTQSKIYVCRRKPTSNWSKINKAHVKNLRASGLMSPAGEACITIAKENGSWTALDKSENLELPPELVKLFKSDTIAANNFENFSNSSKKMILQWIYSAKRPDTRDNRIKTTVQMAHDNLKSR